MTELIKKVQRLQRKPEECEIEALMNDLGETPSIPLLEEVIKRYKKIERDILTGDLLEWMQENDMTTFENEDLKASIQTYVSAKVENADTAFMWLEENQYGDLIKDTLELGKGEFSEEVQAAFDRLGISYSRKSGIHPQSLKKIMSDRLKSGEILPDEDEGFIINYHDEVKIKAK